MSVAFGSEYLLNSATVFATIKPELQGAEGTPLFPIVVASNTAGGRGKLGNLYDWWLGRTALDGDVYGTFQLVCLTGLAGIGTLVWPWDSATPPVVT